MSAATTPIAPSAAAVSAAPDMTLINELYDAIQQNPSGLEARRILMQQFLLVGWLESAGDMAREILKIDPTDDEALQCSKATTVEKQPVCEPVVVDVAAPKPAAVSYEGDFSSTQLELAQGYQRLRSRAKRLQQELGFLQSLKLQDGKPFRYDTHNVDLEALANGRISAVVRLQKPASARSVAREMETQPQEAVDIAVNDLSCMVRWLKSEAGGCALISNKAVGESLASPVRSLSSASTGWVRRWLAPKPVDAPAATPVLDEDGVRDAIVKRVAALKAALPDSLKHHASTSFMHLEHEVLGRKYVNDETMLGDPISEIPRENFFVSEDGYCWCMDELSQALTSGDGVMRNPLSRQMFTTDDVRAIVNHPLGKSLAALQIEQSKLSKGVRPKTVERMDDLAKILLEDMSSDALASRQAIDEFLSYVATLPDAEQQALDKLRVPAKDSHTNQPFDTTIGASVRDAKANLVCFHKTGDFIGQAAAHLRK